MQKREILTSRKKYFKKTTKDVKKNKKLLKTVKASPYQ